MFNFAPDFKSYLISVKHTKINFINFAEKNMATRIVTKIGNIFCINVEGKYLRYFQYIANDLSQLNSSVIRVFKKKYPIDYEFNAEEVVEDEVELYAHTILSQGIREGLWTKVGKSKNVGAFENIIFKGKMLVKSYLAVEEEKSFEWAIWRINGERIRLGYVLPAEFKQGAFVGGVAPAKWVWERIVAGKWNIPWLDEM